MADRLDGLPEFLPRGPEIDPPTPGQVGMFDGQPVHLEMLARSALGETKVAELRALVAMYVDEPRDADCVSAVLVWALDSVVRP